MQQGYAESLLRSGIIEAKAGVKTTARRYLERAIYTSDNNSHDTMAEAWFWMAEITDDPVEKRQALENALSHDLGHARARRALAILDGRIKPEEVVDPDALPLPSTGPVTVQAERLMCPKCGGRMSYAPDGQSLVCEYCTRHQALAVTSAQPDEEDFLQAMATLRGHRPPLAQQVFHCKGCGAEFVLPPTLISANCLYCGSPHVVSVDKSRDLIAPDAVLPHAFDRQQAASYLSAWQKKQKLKPVSDGELPIGLYLPVWTFDLGGEIKYTAQVIRQENTYEGSVPEVARIEDSYAVHLDDLPVPGSRKLARLLMQLLPTFQLRALKPYDPRFLADWPAEVYDIPVGDASLEARGQAFRRLKRQMPVRLGDLHILSASSAGMTVESFKLTLLPVWTARLPQPGPDGMILINGQNGSIAAVGVEKKGIMGWLADVFED